MQPVNAGGNQWKNREADTEVIIFLIVTRRPRNKGLRPQNFLMPQRSLESSPTTSLQINNTGEY